MTDQGVLKVTKSLIIWLFFTLLCGAIVFYKQRLLFADSSHLLFRMINDGSVQIPAFRYGIILPQLLPLEGSLFLLPLSVLMLLYSFSFSLLYTIVALLLIDKFERYDLGILFGFCLCLFVGDTFYAPNNDSIQALMWLLLAIAVPEYFVKKNGSFLLSLLLFFLFFSFALWCHPLSVIMAVYLFLFFWFNKAYSLWPKNQFIFLLIAAVFVLILRIYFNSRINYDSDILAPLFKLRFREIPGLFVNTQACLFLKNCFTNYWGFTIVFCCGIYGMIRAKKYAILTLTLFFSIGYFLFVCATYSQVTKTFYVECEYMPFAVFCSLPFAVFFLPLLSPKSIVIFIGLLLFSRIAYMLMAAPVFIERVALLEGVNEKMRKNNYHKAIVWDDKGFFNARIIMDWASPEESMILSALKDEHPQRTFLIVTKQDLDKIQLPGKDTLLGRFEKRGYLQLNNNYFQLDTTDTYHIINP